MKSEFIDAPRCRAKTAFMTTENKSLVQQALAALLQTGNVDALAPFLSESFVHHRPDASSRTKSEWLAAVEAALVPLAGMDVAVQHLLGDGDRVVMHSLRRLPAGPQIVVVDIWRIEGGRIAEAWEIIEPVAHAAANFRWWEGAKA
jgi:predicted SnoaL-like aldol condensation-catalyzing enzyme